MPSIAEAKRALALYEAEGDIQNANLIREAIEEVEAPRRAGIEALRARNLAQIERDRAFRAQFAAPVEDPGFFENVTSGFGAGAGFDSAQVQTIADEASVKVYATLNDLPLVGVADGKKAFVESNEKFYIWSDTGWYVIALNP